MYVNDPLETGVQFLPGVGPRRAALLASELSVRTVGDLLRLMGVKTQVSTCNIRQLLVREYYDNHHGLCDLGFPETPIADAIRDFHSWKNKQTEI